MNLIRLPLILSLVAFCNNFVLSQACIKQSVKKSLPWKGSQNGQDYDKWQTVELRTLSFRVPSEFKRVESRCIDSECADYRNSDTLIAVDSSDGAGFPTDLVTKSPNYCDEYFLDGTGWIWFWHYYEDKKNVEYPFYSGALFTYGEGVNRKRAGVYYFSKTPYDHELARKIFRSVALK